MTLEEKWEREFEEWWGNGNQFIGFRQSMFSSYLEACRKRQEEMNQRVNELEDQIDYEQTRNRNNVMQADERIREIVERIRKHKEENEMIRPPGEAMPEFDTELYKLLPK